MVWYDYSTEKLIGLPGREIKMEVVSNGGNLDWKCLGEWEIWAGWRQRERVEIEESTKSGKQRSTCTNYPSIHLSHSYECIGKFNPKKSCVASLYFTRFIYLFLHCHHSALVIRSIFNLSKQIEDSKETDMNCMTRRWQYGVFFTHSAPKDINKTPDSVFLSFLYFMVHLSLLFVWSHLYVCLFILN